MILIKQAWLLAFLFMTVTANQSTFSGMTSIKSTSFGSIEIAHYSPTAVKKTVIFAANQREKEMLNAASLSNAAKTHQENLAKMLREGQLARCSSRASDTSEGFHFLPVFVGTLLSESDTVIYKGECFKKLEFSLKFNPSPENYTSLTVIIAI